MKIKSALTGLKTEYLLAIAGGVVLVKKLLFCSLTIKSITEISIFFVVCLYRCWRFGLHRNSASEEAKHNALGHNRRQYRNAFRNERTQSSLLKINHQSNKKTEMGVVRTKKTGAQSKTRK